MNRLPWFSRVSGVTLLPSTGFLLGYCWQRILTLRYRKAEGSTRTKSSCHPQSLIQLRLPARFRRPRRARAPPHAAELRGSAAAAAEAAGTAGPRPHDPAPGRPAAGALRRGVTELGALLPTHSSGQLPSSGGARTPGSGQAARPVPACKAAVPPPLPSRP